MELVMKKGLVRGSLLGLAYGDALGAPIETWDAADIARVFPGGVDMDAPLSDTYLRSLSDGGWSHLRLPGLHTDDTQQAMALLLVAGAPGGFRHEAWGQVLLSGMRLGAWRGFGKNFASAVRKMAKGGASGASEGKGTGREALFLSGADSAGNGAAMRIGPLGALLAHAPGELRRVAIESSLMTHRDMRAALTAHAIAYAVAELVRGQAPGKIASSLPDEVRAALQWFGAYAGARAFGELDQTKGLQVEKVMREVLSAGPGNLTELSLALVASVVSTMGEELKGEPHPNQGLALLSGLFALLAGLLLPVPPRELLDQVVALGKDADTTGAIIGSVLGARYGDAWIPASRLADAARLGRYADQLASASAGASNQKGGPEDMETFLRREAELTRREEGFRRARRQERLGY